MERYIVIAEKPSVARILNKFFRYIRVDAVVSSARGHIMNIDFPREFRWGNVEPLKLFKATDKIKFIIYDHKTYSNLRRLFFRYKERTLVIATDNDSEGELIGYEILMIYEDVHGKNKKYYRMRFNSLEYSELRRSWNRRERSLNWNMVYKALFRSYFDLVTGAAFTRLLTEEGRKHTRVRLISWGSCQTPTLYFIVDRERIRSQFKKERYWYLEAICKYDDKTFKVRSEHFKKLSEAKKYYESISKSNIGRVIDYKISKFINRRPLPLMTDYMLRDLVRITRKDSIKILSIAEKLYNEGYITYPRTETDKYRDGFDFYRPKEVILKSSIGNEILVYSNKDPNPRNGRRDDKAHPPIYPVKPYPKDNSLSWVVWEYIARRYIANAFSDDAFGFRQEVKIAISDIIFKGNGMYIGKYGFYKVFPYFKPKENPIPRLNIGDEVKIIEISIKSGVTKPPDRLSESDLLATMERHGIGTDATRAIYPKLLIDRKYALKKRGKFIPTNLGIKFIEALENVDKSLVTPDTRKYVEELMNMVGEGRLTLDAALKESIEKYRKLFEEVSSQIDKVSKYLYDGLIGKE